MEIIIIQLLQIWIEQYQFTFKVCLVVSPVLYILRTQNLYENNTKYKQINY